MCSFLMILWMLSLESTSLSPLWRCCHSSLCCHCYCMSLESAHLPCLLKCLSFLFSVCFFDILQLDNDVLSWGFWFGFVELPVYEGWCLCARITVQFFGTQQSNKTDMKTIFGQNDLKDTHKKIKDTKTCQYFVHTHFLFDSQG